MARIARAMCKLRIGTVGEGTSWWNSGEDRMSLLKGLERAVREEAGNMSCYELACASLALCRHSALDDVKFCQLMLDAFLNKYAIPSNRSFDFLTKFVLKLIQISNLS